MAIDVLAEESFGHNNKTYFFNLNRAANGTLYMKICRSDKQPDDTYTRQQVVVFEENFEFLIEALRDLFATADHQLHAKEQPLKRVGVPGGIKSWETKRRPREKLLAAGPKSVSDTELLAILIQLWFFAGSAVSLAARILAGADYSLSRLRQMMVMELCAFHGMGHAKSVAILAAMELAKRYQEESLLLR